MVDAGLITVASFISPFEKDRQSVRDTLGTENYIEIYISTPIEECIKRDVKGLYQKAINGEIKEFTGISSPYEKPINPDLEINAAEITKEDALQLILEKVLEKIND
jgi:adenylylsulfate kinase-like enzyme